MYFSIGLYIGQFSIQSYFWIFLLLFKEIIINYTVINKRIVDCCRARNPDLPYTEQQKETHKIWSCIQGNV